MTIGKFITISAIFITAFTFCSCSKDDEDKNEKENGVDIETNAHEYIDLGLPSGTLWATCNVGANSPEEYGYYYAWGETMHKETYNWSTYKWCNGSENTLTKYYTGDNKKQLEPNDDVANINWGSGWFIPSIDQLKELFSYTTSSRIKLKGTEGIELKSIINGKAIIIPCAGYISNGTLYDTDMFYIWSRSLEKGIGWSKCLDSSGQSIHYRCDGLSVRPVRLNK